MAQTMTLSSVGSATMILNPVARTTTVQLTLTTSSTGTCTLNLGLQDPTAVGGSSMIWTTLSSGTVMTTSLIGGPGGGLTYTVLSPVGGLQVTSTATNGTIYVSALQSVTA